MSELRCRITRANIADMFAVLFVSGVSERTSSPANIRCQITGANFADMSAVYSGDILLGGVVSYYIKRVTKYFLDTQY